MMQSNERHDQAITSIVDLTRDYIEATIDGEWTEAMLTVVIEDDASGLTYGRYRTATEPDVWRCFETDYTLYFAFDALRRYMREQGGAPWGHARCALFADGTYNLSFAPQANSERSNGNT